MSFQQYVAVIDLVDVRWLTPRYATTLQSGLYSQESQDTNATILKHILEQSKLDEAR